MIIKTAPPHAYVGKLVSHLQRTDDGNEQIRFLGGRGLVADDDLRDALIEMKAVSAGSQCQKPLYHVAFNAAPGEQLDAVGWERCLSLWEQEMGLEEHQRVVVQHFKDGRWHTHAVWNRVDPETGRAVSIGRDHFSAKRVAREIERELDLERVADDRPAHRQDQQPPLVWESEQARRTKVSAHDIRDQVREAWALSDNGATFQHALAEQGLLLAQGERRPFLVVDGAGNFYALSGRVLPGERADSIRVKLADLDLAALPSIERARELQLQRAALEPEVKDRTDKDGKGGEGAGAPPTLAPDEGAAPAATPIDPRKAIHETYRDAQKALSEQAQAVADKAEAAQRALAEAHQREKALQAAKAQKPWWQRLLKPTKKQQQAAERQRVALEQQQARERAAQDAEFKRQAEAIEQQRAALRAAEKAELTALKIQGPGGPGEPAPPKTPAPTRAFDQVQTDQRRRLDADAVRKLEELKRAEREKERQRQLRRNRGPALGD